ncbi:MAG: alkaline phosphatase family protein [Acidimicrobiia bacterium]|nr:alkaline phosphatase family protein [Acidimicrobiia bacterium]
MESTTPTPSLPDYSGACISNIVPALLEHPDAGRSWIPGAALDADQIVLLLLDGLGFDQLVERRALAPTMSGLDGESISTVAPSTTASALTSLVTGSAPSQHGVIGYRVRTGGETLNVLRWSTASGDARTRIPPRDFQLLPSFADRRPPVITKAEFANSGFTLAHLSGTRLVGYRVTSSLVTEVRRELDAGEPFIYAYYDGIDKVAHEYGLGDHYEAELRAVDRLVGDVLEVLPPGAALVVTADHGHVHIGDRLVEPHADVLEHTAAQSGEARFRWLHASAGAGAALVEAATEHHRDVAWVISIEQALDERLFGPAPDHAILDRYGDVALVPFEPIAFVESGDTGPLNLIGRHGSLTSAEMRVPLLVGSAN